MRILIIDNHDSFTYNLRHLLREVCTEGDTIDIMMNDAIDPAEATHYDKIVISPGPGTPAEAGGLLGFIETFAPSKSILGICLGHQAIAEVFGATLINTNTVYHGVKSTIEITADSYLFDGLPRSIDAGRYHSWLVGRENLPECLGVTAIDGEGQIMALSHKTYDLHGVQFHPESIMTPNGRYILSNFITHR